jgi:DNA polymerase
LLIGDIPEMQDIENGHMPSGQMGELVQRMMQAIGIAAGSYCYTALATTRPATGALPDNDLPMLGQFMEHQIALIKPEKVIIFGSAACQALLGADVMDKRGNLHYFNHNVQRVAAVTTFHPRTLLARPQLKGQAWRDLQVLMK